MDILFAVVGWVTAGTVLLWVAYRETLRRLWREPVLQQPVLIIESDDWGAGPQEQAAQLDRIAAVLAGYRDHVGRKPVMTLGIVLGVVDGARVLADRLRSYHVKHLDEPDFAATLEAIERGMKAGVFSAQLHCEEHYWPPTLLGAARSIPEIAVWLTGMDGPRTELLPPALQSRWIDSTVLPAKALQISEIRDAVQSEVACFRRVFGTGPRVAVPPTFVWNDAVEAAWAECGVQFVVTPGRRFESRDGRGEPIAVGRAIVNGDCGRTGVRYIVRDDYFEPARGHRAEQALVALVAKTRAGRPTLLETHRANFISGTPVAEAAIGEIDRLLALALKLFPGVVFMSTEDLATRLHRRDANLVANQVALRIHIWLRRLWNVSRLRKLAFLTGTVIPGIALYWATWGSAARTRTSVH